jgi:hypothetical protein
MFGRAAARMRTVSTTFHHMLQSLSWIGRSVALAGIITLLASCGGGGGGAGAIGDDGSGGGGPTPSSLVPVAGPLGATLYARAADLRPLRDGAVWTYRSVDRVEGTYREISVRQTATSGGRMVETDSSDPGSPVTVGTDASGAVLFATRLALGEGLPTLDVEGVELPSPVRANAQTVLLDQQIDDPSTDLDGDNLADRVDVAMWRTVIGNEDLTPPDGGTPLRALRVDTAAAVRVTYSGGSPPVTETIRLRTWYAAGIGIVRNAVESGSGQPLFEAEDWLLGFDGIDRGWGWVRREALTLPGGAAVYTPTSALATSDGLLAAGGATVFDIDRTGRLRASHDLVGRDGEPFTIKRLLRFDAGVRAVSVAGSVVETMRLEEDGRPLPDPTQTSFGAANPANGRFDFMVGPHAAPGATRAWAAWTRSEIQGSRTEVALRAMDASGAFATPELSFAATATVITETLKLAPRTSGTVLQWLERADDGSMVQRMVFVDNAGTVTLDRRFALGIDANGFAPLVRPLLNGDDFWWLWSDRTPTLDTRRPHALRIDATTGLAVGGPLDRTLMVAAELAPMDDDLVNGFPDQVHAQDGRWFAIGAGRGMLYPDGDGSTEEWLTFAELDPGTGAPAGGATRERMKAKIPLLSSSLSAPVVFDDRVILLPTDSSGRVRPVVVWRR